MLYVRTANKLLWTGSWHTFPTHTYTHRESLMRFIIKQDRLLLITRNMFDGTSYLPHSRVHNNWTVHYNQMKWELLYFWRFIHKGRSVLHQVILLGDRGTQVWRWQRSTVVRTSAYDRRTFAGLHHDMQLTGDLFRVNLYSDVSPWPWSLRPKYKSLALTVVLGLGRRLGKIVTHYIDTINSLSFDSHTELADICSQMEFVPRGYLFERIFAVLASSARVERVLSKSGLSSANTVRKCLTKCFSHWCLRSVPSSADCCDHEQCAWLILW